MRVNKTDKEILRAILELKAGKKVELDVYNVSGRGRNTRYSKSVVNAKIVDGLKNIGYKISTINIAPRGGKWGELYVITANNYIDGFSEFVTPKKIYKKEAITKVVTTNNNLTFSGNKVVNSPIYGIVTHPVDINSDLYKAKVESGLGWSSFLGL